VGALRVSDFARRARLYRALDRRLAARTRFFGAAALTNQALAELFSRPAGRLCVSAATFDFLARLGHYLESINTGQAVSMQDAAGHGETLDQAMVSLEQSEVQAHLERLQRSDPGAHETTVLQLNRLLTTATLRAVPPSLFPSAANYAQVLRAVGAELGHTVSFARQKDRECIGQTLIRRLRTLSSTRV
jgi:hypothetical protein